MTSIDHPGNITLVTGLVLATFGLVAMLNPDVGRCDRAEHLKFCALAVLPSTVLGMGLFAYGGVVWGRSRSGAGPGATGAQGSAMMPSSRAIGLQAAGRF